MHTTKLHNEYTYTHIHRCINFFAYVYKVDFCPYVMPLAWFVQYQLWDIHLRIYLQYVYKYTHKDGLHTYINIHTCVCISIRANLYI